MSNPKLAIVIGSVRPNRFAAHAAEWIEQIARQRRDFDVELVDLKDYPMPLFAEEASPLYAPPKNQVARRWQAKLAEFDAFIFTAAEYNHGPHGGSEERARLRLCRVEQQAGCLCRLRRGRRLPRGGAVTAECHRAADGADPQRGSHSLSRLFGRGQRRQEAKRARSSQSDCPPDARSAGMVDCRPQSSARGEFTPGGLVGGSP